MLVETYLTRARDFLRGVDLIGQDSEYNYSSALLAIHGAISYSDAIRCGLGGTNLAADDHRSASAEVRQLLANRGYANTQGVRHLETLVGKKTFVSYSGTPLTQDDTNALVNHARRFAAWAEQVGLNLRIERWRDGATQ